MTNELYQTIFKRKSFHLFRGVGNEQLTEAELAGIHEAYEGFERLCPDTKTAMRILPADKVSFRRDAEYWILLYSENKPNYLTNIGYLGEQLDLYLTKNHIGSLWYGMGKPGELDYEGLEFVIMLAIHKVSDESLFRKDMFKAKRKPLQQIWSGETLGVGEIARFSPSACNSQPWIVKNEGGALEVTRYRKPGRLGLLSPKAAFYMNRIDMGIFLCILEICLAEKGIDAKRTLFVDETDREYSPVARYTICE